MQTSYHRPVVNERVSLADKNAKKNKPKTMALKRATFFVVGNCSNPQKRGPHPHVMYNHLPEAVGQDVLGLLVAPVTNVGHEVLALEAATHPVVDTLRLAPVWLWKRCPVSARLPRTEVELLNLHSAPFSGGLASTAILFHTAEQARAS